MHGRYALTAALRDRRFPPISPSEVPLLRCTVSLLHGFERAASWTDWQVRVPSSAACKKADCQSGSRHPLRAQLLMRLSAHLSHTCVVDCSVRHVMQVGVHGLIINFTDPETLQPRTATFLPEVGTALTHPVVIVAV